MPTQPRTRSTSATIVTAVYCLTLLSAAGVLNTSSLSAGEVKPGVDNGFQIRPHGKLRSVDLDEVRWTEGFWADRFELARGQMIPHLWRYFCGETESIGIPKERQCQIWRNFLIAAGKADGEFYKPDWNDGDFYKWLEAVVYAYSVTRDDDLKQLMADVVPVIEAAQQPDGYISTQITTTGRERFQHFNAHETYNMGHLMIAGCAHHRVTGDRRLLAVAERAGDYLCQQFMVPDAHFLGYTSVMGLLDLYRTTDQRKYLDLAGRFVDMHGASRGEERGRGFGTDQAQDRRPLREETMAVGHAVWGMYLYCGATDVFAETGDPTLLVALKRIWDDVHLRKLYLHGGNSAYHHGLSPARNMVGEAFGTEYRLPNRSAMCETCANIGDAMWNRRLLSLEPDAKYADAMERVLYNSMLSGMALDGKSFLYTNPLRWHGGELPMLEDDTLVRWNWRKGFCCPPNLLRTLTKLHTWAYDFAPGSVWVHLYGGSRVRGTLDDGARIEIFQHTDYPWDGKVRFTVTPGRPSNFTLMLRIPSWTTDAQIRINGDRPSLRPKPGGYHPLTRTWSAGDVVELDLPMRVRLIEAHPWIEELRGQVAVGRGPLVYCLESHELPDGVRISEIVVPADIELTPRHDPALLGGITVLEGEAWRRPEGDWSGKLYRDLNRTRPEPIRVRLIPYYAWNNRGVSHMSVWMPID